MVDYIVSFINKIVKKVLQVSSFIKSLGKREKKLLQLPITSPAKDGHCAVGLNMGRML